MSFFEFSFHILPKKNIFPWSKKIPGLIWVFFFEFFLKIVINWYSFSKLCDRRSFYDHSQNMWSTITHNHDRWNWVKKYLRSLMIVIWSEMIGDHDLIAPTLDYPPPTTPPKNALLLFGTNWRLSQLISWSI